MTNITVGKIDEIIKKIEENIPKKGLGEEEVKVLLMGIDSDLAGVKKNAEEKHKEIVDKKVKELRGKISESVSDEDPWWKVKDALNKDIKDGLEGLKGKIIELEKPQVPTIIEYKPSDDVIVLYKKEIERLEANYKEEKEKREKAEMERDEYKNKLEIKDREVFKLENKKGENTGFSKEVIDRAHDYWKDAVETGVTEGS